MESEVIWSIIGTTVAGLLLIVGFFANKALSKIDEVAADVGKILIISGITDEKIKSHEEQITFLQAKAHDNAEKWAYLYKEYNLHAIRNK